MKTRLEQVLERYLNGREIAVWGVPTRRLLRVLRPYQFHVADSVDPQCHYVIAVNKDDLSDFLSDEQSKSFQYIYDYLTFNDEGDELPFERMCFNVHVGRQTYFGDGVVGACKNGYIKSIGQFTSINGTARIHVNHQLNMTFVSDDIQNFFNKKSMALFQNKLRNDPKHPYAYSKEPITIGSDVYIGAHAFINASTVTSIGDGAIIGSGAVVLENVPPFAVVVGVPARIKRYRFSKEMIEALLRVKWWDWSIEEINENADALLSPELFMEKYGTL
jgi:acetyltransferase-like isoleucine patch superfamily enzyme